MPFVKIILAFAPWIAFLIIAQGSLFRLQLGLVVALALSVLMGVLRLHRGVILWAGLSFFAGATIAVVVLDNIWTAQHMGVLANGALAASSWATIAIGKPFSLDYAREHSDPALWERPDFIRANVVITALWAMTFTANAALAWGKIVHFLLPGWGYEAVSYTLLVGTAAFTTWYPKYLRRARQMSEPSAPPEGDP